MSDTDPQSPSASDTVVFPAGRLLPFRPSEILPAMQGRYGLSVGRSLIATALFASTLALMKAVPNAAIAGIVIPIWLAAAGCLVDGYRGATRGIIVAVVYPLYLSIVIAIMCLIFWVYVMLHQSVSGEQVLW